MKVEHGQVNRKINEIDDQPAGQHHQLEAADIAKMRSYGQYRFCRKMSGS
jgi:hypothetical protein